MSTFRFAVAPALALTLALTLTLSLTSGTAHAGVRGSTYFGDFDVDGSGSCDEMTFAFDMVDGVQVSGCAAVYDGTFSEIDLFFFGIWSLEASTSRGSQQPELVLSGLHLFFGTRFFGSGRVFGAKVDVIGAWQSPVLPAEAHESWPSDLHRSPARL
jgi:hypothetical protein